MAMETKWRREREQEIDGNRERDLEGYYGDSRRHIPFTVNQHREVLSQARIRHKRFDNMHKNE